LLNLVKSYSNQPCGDRTNADKDFLRGTQYTNMSIQLR